jgi:hypothetical protein
LGEFQRRVIARDRADKKTGAVARNLMFPPRAG